MDLFVSFVSVCFLFIVFIVQRLMVCLILAALLFGTEITRRGGVSTDAASVVEGCLLGTLCLIYLVAMELLSMRDT